MVHFDDFRSGSAKSDRSPKQASHSKSLMSLTTRPGLRIPTWIRDERIASFAGHPLLHRGEVLGVLGLFAREAPGESCFEWLRMIADHLAAAIANARAMDEIEALKKRLEQENEYLREEVQQAAAFGDLIGQAPSLQAVTRQIELVAPTNSAVLILGESGTGKEVVAREIHRHSRRAERPLIKVNCAADPAGTLRKRILRTRQRCVHRCTA